MISGGSYQTGGKKAKVRATSASGVLLERQTHISQDEIVAEGGCTRILHSEQDVLRGCNTSACGLFPAHCTGLVSTSGAEPGG